MKLGVCFNSNEKSAAYGKRADFIFSPLFELLASMHVICSPMHHTGRTRWWVRTERSLAPELIAQIRVLGDRTGMWLIPMDYVMPEAFWDVDVPDSLNALGKLSLHQWNKVFTPYGVTLKKSEKDSILAVMREYYELYFCRELDLLTPIMVKKLGEEMTAWKSDSFEPHISALHDRITATTDEIILYKDHEYHFPYNKLESLLITGSFFLSPHLIMGHTGNTLMLTKHYHLEQSNKQPPQELCLTYRALGDPTRLLILRALMGTPDTTQHLAAVLGLSEAAISKQLKLLHGAKLVQKERRGGFIYYSICPKTLDFLTYRIYEYLAQ